MKSVKRLEIIIGAAHIPRLVEMLRQAGAPGYTLIRDVQGSGDRGDRSGDELTDVYRNCLMIVAVPAEQCEALIEAIRPMIQRFGGVCLVSDAQWVKH